MRDWLIRKLGGTPPGAQSRVLGGVPKRRELVPGLPRGRWVVWNERVGIAHDVTDDGLIEVHLVNEKGETILVTHQAPDTLRHAKRLEIPEARRPTQATATLRGYEEGDE